MLSSCHVLTPGPLKSKILRKAKFFDPYFHSQNVLQPQAILGSVAAKSQGLELAFAALTKAQLEGFADFKMGSKALILISMVCLACAANAAEQMTTMQQLENQGRKLSQWWPWGGGNNGGYDNGYNGGYSSNNNNNNNNNGGYGANNNNNNNNNGGYGGSNNNNNNNNGRKLKDITNNNFASSGQTITNNNQGGGAPISNSNCGGQIDNNGGQLSNCQG